MKKSFLQEGGGNFNLKIYKILQFRQMFFEDKIKARVEYLKKNKNKIKINYIKQTRQLIKDFALKLNFIIKKCMYFNFKSRLCLAAYGCYILLIFFVHVKILL